MRLMRALLIASVAVAIVAVLVVPGVRADEYNKLTYLTFSGPVQVPGVTLPAGTYMFKLADPDTGRRAIQIWSQDGTKLYTTLLTIPDEMMAAQSDPVVMFKETPSGSPNAIKSWFYPGERIGQEFIYPKDQAMRIATANNTPVLAYTEELKSDSDVGALRSAGVGRVSADGQVTSSTTTASTASSTTTASASTAQSTTTAPNANVNVEQSAPAATTTTAAATTTTAPAASTTAAQPSAPAAATVETTPATAATNAPAGRSDLSIDQNVPPQSARAVGTTGQAQTGRRLPRTASPLAALELLSVSTLVAALGVRRLRRHVIETQQ
jgi:hypothetical protein